MLKVQLAGGLCVNIDLFYWNWHIFLQFMQFRTRQNIYVKNYLTGVIAAEGKHGQCAEGLPMVCASMGPGDLLRDVRPAPW